MARASAGRLRAERRRGSTLADEGPSGELNITPFLDVVVNLVLFLLATTAAVLATTEIEVRLPDVIHGGRGGRVALVATPSLFLTAHGVIATDAAGTLAPGCAAPGARGEVAVPPPPGGGLDREALTRCVAAMRGRSEVDELIVGADPEIPYQDLVTAMDAARGPSPERGFSALRLSAGVR